MELGPSLSTAALTAGSIYIGASTGSGFGMLGGTVAATGITVGYGQPSTGVFTVGGSAQVTAQTITAGYDAAGVGQYMQTGGIVNLSAQQVLPASH